MSTSQHKITALPTAMVQQEAFDGPLDLLLSLIEAEKLDITSISLAAVTDGYLAHVEQLERQHLPEIAEWLVVAARLLLLKSRALLPTEGEVEEETDDDLAAQLAEYKLFKELAAQLDVGLRSTRGSIGKAPSALEFPSQVVTAGVDLARLESAFASIVERLPVERPQAGPDIESQVSLEERIEAVQHELANGPQPFERLFVDLRSKVALIVTFLAILELFKQRLVAIIANQPKLTLELRKGTAA